MPSRDCGGEGGGERAKSCGGLSGTRRSIGLDGAVGREIEEGTELSWVGNVEVFAVFLRAWSEMGMSLPEVASDGTS